MPTIYDSATINARAITDGVQSNSHFTPADYLSHLSFAFFLAGEARKGQVQLSDDGRWFMPYYADIGSGANNWTWMAMIGTGYRYDRGKVTVALRNLSYNFNGRGDSSLDMRMTGFAAGVTFPF